MSTQSEKDTIIHKLINEYKEKYFFLEENEKVESKLNEAFNSLVKIRDFPPLLSKSYIRSRKLIREENDQYRKEIRTRTQCLKAENTVFVDPNHSIDTLGFNKVPWIHFKFIGLAIGEYKIKNIPKKLAFGLLYDFEEFPNKEFSYDVTEKSLELIPETYIDDYGEEKIKMADKEFEIIEDKWINAPGDVDDDDKFDSLLNLGPHNFLVKFYYGDITLKVTGNFGICSYYLYDIENEKILGYMGGQKRLKFSELCLING